MDPELDLMRRVNNLAGPYLRKFSPMNSAPLAFWVALTANETGMFLIHDTNLFPRLEAGVLQDLQETAAGLRSHYGSLTPAVLRLLDAATLRKMASSWGFTQVMGYHTLGWPGKSVADLDNPATHYPLAARVLAELASRSQVDVTRDFETMFRLWNTGKPNGQTYDSHYVANGLARMALWQTHFAGS